MSENPDKPKKEKKGGWGAFFLKFIFFSVAILLIGLTVLANIGGHTEDHRAAVESYASYYTGYKAHIDKLNNFQFFPDIIVDFEGLELSDPLKSDYSRAKIGKVQLAISFWDIVFSSGKLKKLNLENVVLHPGAFTPYAIKVDHARIFDDGKDKASFEMAGYFDKYPMKASIGMKASGGEKSRKYSLAEERNVSLSLGQLKAKGKMKTVRGTGSELHDLIVSMDDEVATGSLSFYDRGYQNFKIKTDLILSENGTKLKSDLDYIKEDSIPRFEGTVNMPHFYYEDFKDGSRFKNTLGYIDEIFGPKKAKPASEGEDETAEEPRLEPVSLPGFDWDLTVKIDQMNLNRVSLGNIDFKTKKAKGKATLKSTKAMFDNAKSSLEGSLTVPKEGDATFDMALHVLGLEYGKLQEKLTEKEAGIHGKADIDFQAQSTGQTYEDLYGNLEGKVHVIAGNGKLSSSAIDLWGGGLMNALVPSFDSDPDLKLNCGILEAPIENGVANVDVLFLDTKRVTVMGEGDYDFQKDRLDVKLKPQSKGIAVGDIAPGVVLSGPLFKPEASPSLTDLGLKIGSLFLGTINPIFAAATLTDYGLTEDHPCAAYFKDGSEEADTSQDEGQEEAQEEVEPKQEEIVPEDQAPLEVEDVPEEPPKVDESQKADEGEAPAEGAENAQEEAPAEPSNNE